MIIDQCTGAVLSRKWLFHFILAGRDGYSRRKDGCLPCKKGQFGHSAKKRPGMTRTPLLISYALRGVLNSSFL
jgi:hypothetical protein